MRTSRTVVLFLICIGALAIPSLADEPFRIAGAKITPIYIGDQFVGLRFTRILPDSCLANLGIREGDTAIELDGEPIRSVSDSVRFLDAIGGNLVVTLGVVDAQDKHRTVSGRGCDLVPQGQPS